MNDFYALISITFFELPSSLKLGLTNSSNFENVQSNMLPPKNMFKYARVGSHSV